MAPSHHGAYQGALPPLDINCGVRGPGSRKMPPEAWSEEGARIGYPSMGVMLLASCASCSSHKANKLPR